MRPVRKNESNGIAVSKNLVYSVETMESCRKKHKELVDEGKIEGGFFDEKWICTQGIDKNGIVFRLDTKKYDQHIGKLFGISKAQMLNMLRSYTIVLFNVYIIKTLLHDKIKTIKAFVQKYPEPGLKMTANEKAIIKDFLTFISTPKAQIKQILNSILTVEEKPKKRRQLSHIISYLVIAEEISRIFAEGCAEKLFIELFPVYFWVKITFILPLRVTEMLLTPKECIVERADGTYINVRRSKLKKQKRKVEQDVNKDYKVFTYKIPDGEVVENIKKYIKLTSYQKRRFLFAYNVAAINNMVSRRTLNNCINSFVESYINNNSRYDFVKYALRMNKFEQVCAGDSRHIALQNLRYQGVSIDVCRQLADQDSLDICAGYYTNTSETVWASSIIEYLRKINDEETQKEESLKKGEVLVVDIDESICTSLKRNMDWENLEDCVIQDHLEECIGCTYYRVSKKELNEYMCIQQQRLDEVAEKTKEFTNKLLKAKKSDMTIDEITLAFLTEVQRYKIGCDIKAKEIFEEWQRHKNTLKINY